MASPPFDVDHTTPGDADVVSFFPADNRSNMDIIESWLNFIADSTTGHLQISVDTTANLPDSSYPTGGLAYDTTLSKLKVRLAGGWQSIGPEFPSGTRMVFQQTSAPAGWTKVTDAAYEDAVMLLTTGTVATAGSVAASTFLLDGNHFEDGAFVAGGSTSSDGAHTHTPLGGGSFIVENGGVTVGGGTTHNKVATTSSDGAHTHTFSAFASSSEVPLFTHVKSVEFIVAQKD